MRQAATRHLLHAMRFADNPTGTSHPGRIRTGNGTSFDLAGGRFVVKPGSVCQPRDGDPPGIVPGVGRWCDRIGRRRGGGATGVLRHRDGAGADPQGRIATLPS
ncbi:MAG: hypothetical protein EBU40_13765 [Proteobacteria bacterium]|nr:hypothetical protein [Pseudomonadota bacterium]